ncbi:PEGA domain-containing protein [Mucilaginibacter sp. UYCu711]|uniref:PEGA domain-containing protein n=1 Tax=Mucilaginibacter sp. UYCu711 TaxID=3156339 RepID=UPI003D21D17F
MKKLYIFLSGAVALVILSLFSFKATAAEKITITTSPQTARIYVDGIQMGTGKTVIKVEKNSCVTVEVKMEGYVQETRNYCNKKGMADPPKSDYIQLQEDESFTSSIESNIANTEIQVNVKNGKTKEEAWKQIMSTVLDKFDVLENSDEKVGYLRTSWVGISFKSNTIRIRLIIKQSSETPLIYRVKFVSESSGRSSTPYNADEQYRPFNRILKKYDGFLDELTTRLKN